MPFFIAGDASKAYEPATALNLSEERCDHRFGFDQGFVIYIESANKFLKSIGVELWTPRRISQNRKK